jgi:hypothetical protein
MAELSHPEVLFLEASGSGMDREQLAARATGFLRGASPGKCSRQEVMLRAQPLLSLGCPAHTVLSLRTRAAVSAQTEWPSESLTV